MATVTREVQECDWHPGEDAVETMLIQAAGGKKYVVDVCAACQAELTSVGRPVRPTRRKRAAANGNGHSRRKTLRTRAAELADMRQWARENNYPVSDRGKVPGEVQRAYKAAKKA